MGVAESMQAFVTLNNLVIDPGVGAGGATLHHFDKTGVDTNFENVLLPDAAQPMRNMKIGQGNDGAWFGRKPFDDPRLHRHGEYAQTIAFEKQLRFIIERWERCSVEGLQRLTLLFPDASNPSTL